MDTSQTQEEDQQEETMKEQEILNTNTISNSMKEDSNIGLPSEFPSGLRIMVVDDKFSEELVRMLKYCRYEVTTFSSAIEALSFLRENENEIDIVLSGIHIDDSDGIELLEYISKDTDITLIIMSNEYNKDVAMKSVELGASDYLVKPIDIKSIQTIWLHLERKKKNHLKKPEQYPCNCDETHKHRKLIKYGVAESSSSSDESGRNVKRKNEAEEDETENKYGTSIAKRQRVVWSSELHEQFVKAVEELGPDKAVPKKILEVMDNPNITRENVASHLQKYRQYKRNEEDQRNLATSQAEANTGLVSGGRLAHRQPPEPIQDRLQSRNLPQGLVGRLPYAYQSSEFSPGMMSPMAIAWPRPVPQQQQIVTRRTADPRSHGDNISRRNQSSTRTLRTPTQNTEHLRRPIPPEMVPPMVGISGQIYNSYTQPYTRLEFPMGFLPSIGYNNGNEFPPNQENVPSHMLNRGFPEGELIYFQNTCIDTSEYGITVKTDNKQMNPSSGAVLSIQDRSNGNSTETNHQRPHSS